MRGTGSSYARKNKYLQREVPVVSVLLLLGLLLISSQYKIVHRSEYTAATNERTHTTANSTKKPTATATPTKEPSASKKPNNSNNNNNNNNTNSVSKEDQEEQEWQDFVVDYRGRNQNKSPPVGMRSWLTYAQSNNCNERDYYETITHDLHSFRQAIKENNHTKLKQEDILPHGLKNLGKGNSLYYLALELRNHTIKGADPHSVRSGKNNFYQALFEPIRLHEPPLNATYFLAIDDMPSPRFHSKLPIFTYCRGAYWTEDMATPRDTPLQVPSLSLLEHDNTNNKNNIVWEDNEHDYAYSVQNNVREQHPYANSNGLVMPYHRDWDPPPGTTSWNTTSLLNFVNRSDTIGWRGGLTGFPQRLHGHRGRLMTTYGGFEPHYIREDIPVMVDFGITHEPSVNSNGTMRKTSSMSYEESQQNKYMMDVDGNSFISRFRKLLLSGSVVFKSSRYRQWFTERLHPFVDYVPVNYNLTDRYHTVVCCHLTVSFEYHLIECIKEDAVADLITIPIQASF